MSNSKKVKSGHAIRTDLLTWGLRHNGLLIRESKDNPVFGGVIGGTMRIPLTTGALLVHLPCDDIGGYGFSINSQFTEGAPFPKDANPYSGKWNFSCYKDTKELLRDFDSCFNSYVKNNG